MQNPQFCLVRWWTRRRLANLLVLLPRRLLAFGGAEVAGFAPCASFRCGGLTDVALVGRLLQHVLHLDQLSLVVLHVLDERASVVIDAEDLLVDELLGKVLSEEGGEGGGGDVQGGEAEDVLDFVARLVLGRASILEGRVIIGVFSLDRKGVPMDYSKSKKHEGVAVFLALHGNLSKKIRIGVFEHFTHQLVIVLIEELVTVCIRS